MKFSITRQVGKALFLPACAFENDCRNFSDFAIALSNKVSASYVFKNLSILLSIKIL